MQRFNDATLFYCSVCFHELRTAPSFLVPCGHRVCNTCAGPLSNCPLCRTEITAKIQDRDYGELVCGVLDTQDQHQRHEPAEGVVVATAATTTATAGGEWVMVADEKKPNESNTDSKVKVRLTSSLTQKEKKAQQQEEADQAAFIKNQIKNRKLKFKNDARRFDIVNAWYGTEAHHIETINETIYTMDPVTGHRVATNKAISVKDWLRMKCLHDKEEAETETKNQQHQNGNAKKISVLSIPSDMNTLYNNTDPCPGQTKFTAIHVRNMATGKDMHLRAMEWHGMEAWTWPTDDENDEFFSENSSKDDEKEDRFEVVHAWYGTNQANSITHIGNGNWNTGAVPLSRYLQCVCTRMEEMAVLTENSNNNTNEKKKFSAKKKMILELPTDMNAAFGFDPVPGVVKILAVHLRHLTTGEELHIRAKEWRGLKFYWPSSVPADASVKTTTTEASKTTTTASSTVATKAPRHDHHFDIMESAWYGTEEEQFPVSAMGITVSDLLRCCLSLASPANNKGGAATGGAATTTSSSSSSDQKKGDKKGNQQTKASTPLVWTLNVPANMNHEFGPWDPAVGKLKTTAFRVRHSATGEVLELRAKEWEGLTGWQWPLGAGAAAVSTSKDDGNHDFLNDKKDNKSQDEDEEPLMDIKKSQQYLASRQAHRNQVLHAQREDDFDEYEELASGDGDVSRCAWPKEGKEEEVKGGEEEDGSDFEMLE